MCGPKGVRSGEVPLYTLDDAHSKNSKTIRYIHIIINCIKILTTKTFIKFIPISSGGHLAHVYVCLPDIHKIVL